MSGNNCCSNLHTPSRLPTPPLVRRVFIRRSRSRNYTGQTLSTAFGNRRGLHTFLHILKFLTTSACSPPENVLAVFWETVECLICHRVFLMVVIAWQSDYLGQKGALVVS